jgi:uncharacterized protein (TIGR02421 family)
LRAAPRGGTPTFVDADTARERLSEVAGALASLKSNGNLLVGIGWGRDVEEAFFAHGATRLPEPTYAIDTHALHDESKALRRLARGLSGDAPVLAFLRGAVLAAVERNELLCAAGTKAFGALSREIYGGARTTFFGLPRRNVDLADHLLERLRIHGWDEAKERERAPLDAPTFAAELVRRIGKHRPRIDVEVVLDERCASKAIAGMTKVRVRPDATFSAWEADGLFCHEVETHAYTAHNGAAQEKAPFLRAGGPRSTATQEGLAVFAELYDHALATPRLERLALRVKMVELAEDGADFLELYRFLLARGRAPRDAYLDAARVCRGGLVEGGAPFTKDSCYLAGLLHVYAFLSVFVRGGFHDEVEMLVAGRIAVEDIVALVELRGHGLLTRPVHRPRWLERWSALLSYFSFASFMDAIDLAPVEAHYAGLLSLAESARPKG